MPELQFSCAVIMYVCVYACTSLICTPDRCDWLLTTNVPHMPCLRLVLAASLCLPCPLGKAHSLLNQASTAGSTCPPGSSQSPLHRIICLHIIKHILKKHLTCKLNFPFWQRYWCNRHPKRKVECDARLLCIVFGGSCFRTAAFSPNIFWAIRVP